MTEPMVQHPMSFVDRAWLRMDEPDSLMVINGVMLFDARLDTDEVKRLLLQRLQSVPRFRQCPVQPHGRGRHVWQDHPGFSIEQHVCEVDLGSGGEGDLQDLVSHRMSESLAADQPLWQVTVVHMAEASALLWRLHHCIGDGIGLMVLVLALTELQPDSAATPDHNPLFRLFHDVGMVAAEAKHHVARLMPDAVTLLSRPAEVLQSSNRWLRRGVAAATFGKISLYLPDARTAFKGPLNVAKRVAWSEAVPMDRVQEIRRQLGATVNDLLLTATAGGLRRYLLESGRGVARSFRGVIPVSLRPLEQMADLGNQFGLVFLRLPIGIADPGQRLLELQRRMKSLKRSAEPLVVLNVLKLIGMAPRPVQNLVLRIFGAKATAVMTNVPGPRERLYFSGHPIRSIIFWVPQSGRLGMGISLLSYAGEVRLGVATDAGLVPDPEKITASFNEELDVLSSIRT